MLLIHHKQVSQTGEVLESSLYAAYGRERMERCGLWEQIYDLFFENTSENDKFNLRLTVLVWFWLKITRLTGKLVLFIFLPINLGI